MPAGRMNKSPPNVHKYAQPVKRTAAPRAAAAGSAGTRRQKNFVTPMKATVPMPTQ